MKKRFGLATIQIIFIIAVIAVAAYFVIMKSLPIPVGAEGRDAKRITDLAKIQSALQAYYTDHNQYPENNAAYEIVDRAAIDWGNEWIPYLNILPKDPGPNRYVYISDDSLHQTYRIYTSLEDPANNKKTCAGDETEKCTFAPDNACGGVCNYGITSSNASP